MTPEELDTDRRQSGSGSPSPPDGDDATGPGDGGAGEADDTDAEADDTDTGAEAGDRDGSPAAADSDRTRHLEEDLARVRAEADESRSDHLRALAELENVRRRSAREIEERSRRAREDVLTTFLAAADDVERALAHMDGESGGEEEGAIVDGVRLIHGRLLELLARYDVSPMDVIGTEFDPRLHEAVASVETEGVEPDHIAHVLQSGYWIGERVLRPARVAVARPRETDAS